MPDTIASVSAVFDASSQPGLAGSGVARLLMKFSDAVDGQRVAEIGPLFTDEGLFRPGGDAIQGPEAIGAFYAKRLTDPRRRTRHIWSNLQVERLGEGRARVKVVLTNYAFEPAVSEDQMQMRMGNIDALCEAGPDGEWRFAEHFYERLFAVSFPLNGPPPAPLGKN
jgi:hypothetical protein